MRFLWFKTRRKKQEELENNWYKDMAFKNADEWQLQMAVASDIGRVRSNNEDNFLLDSICNEEQTRQYFYEEEQSLDQCRIAAVFDGMGGECSGELASLTAARMMGAVAANQRGTDLKTFTQMIKDSFCEINNQIVEYQNEKKAMIGTTAVVICTDGEEFQVMNCGDSRAYLFRGGLISCLTKDHTLAAERIARGEYLADCKAAKRDKHSLTSFLGIDTKLLGLVPDECGWYDLEEDDILLLCSDGLTDACSNDDIETILSEDVSLGEKVQVLLETAMRQGSKDNITCLLVRKNRQKKLDKGVVAYGKN